MFNYKIIIILFFVTFLSFSQQRNQKVDNLVIKALTIASDTARVYRIKKIIGKKFKLYKNRFDYIPSINPLNPKKLKRVSSKFGERFHPIEKKRKAHLGLDIASDVGTPIHASADGTIESIITSNYGYGNQIVIKHRYGFTTRYAHLHSFHKIKKGMRIKKGRIIGFVGTSGKSTGYHLHYEILKNGRAIDPYPFCFLNI